MKNQKANEKATKAIIEFFNFFPLSHFGQINFFRIKNDKRVRAITVSYTRHTVIVNPTLKMEVLNQ